MTTIIKNILFIGLILGLSACGAPSKDSVYMTNPDAFAGIYTADNNGRVYKIIIKKHSNSAVDGAVGQPMFVIFGFFNNNEALFMQKLDEIIALDVAGGQKNVCTIMQNKFCAKKQRTEYICQSKNMIYPLDIYLNSPGKYGLLMFKSGSNGGLFGDKYDKIKGNFLLPAKEYGVHSLHINAQSELASIKFNETGFIQAFTSETLVFKKITSRLNIDKTLNNKINAYLKVKNTLEALANNHSAQFFNGCGF